MDAEHAAADEAEGERETAAESRAHLEDVDDGCGCAEVWEHLSDRRDD